MGTVEKATENFIEKGEIIAYENPDITQEMLAAVEEVRKTGTKLYFIFVCKTFKMFLYYFFFFSK